MVRTAGKQKSVRLVLVCVGLLGFGVIANYLWASSPRLSNWSVDNSLTNLIIPRTEDPFSDATFPAPKVLFPFFFQLLLLQLLATNSDLMLGFVWLHSFF